jgi:hypothetical protein
VSDQLQNEIRAKLIHGPTTSYELSKGMKEPETFVLIALWSMQKRGLVKPAEQGKWALADDYQIKE